MYYPISEAYQYTLLLSAVAFVVAVVSLLLAVALCGGKKEAPPADGGEAAAKSTKDAVSKSAKEAPKSYKKSQKFAKQPTDTVPKGEYGTLRNIEQKMAASQGGKAAEGAPNFEVVGGDKITPLTIPGKVESGAYGTIAAAGKLNPTMGAKKTDKVAADAYGTLAVASDKALSPSIAPKKGAGGGQVGADAYGTLQIADKNALNASKRAGGGKAPGFAPKNADYGTLFNVDNKMAASKRA